MAKRNQINNTNECDPSTTVPVFPACPHCGRCPRCGRGPYQIPYQRPQPFPRGNATLINYGYTQYGYTQ